MNFSPTDTGAKRAPLFVLVCARKGDGGGAGCSGREWHRWHGAPAVPRASDRHVAHSQPHTTYAKGGRERDGGRG